MCNYQYIYRRKVIKILTRAMTSCEKGPVYNFQITVLCWPFLHPPFD